MNNEILLSKEKIEKAFNTFDINQDGFISHDEFKALMGGIKIDKTTW